MTCVAGCPGAAIPVRAVVAVRSPVIMISAVAATCFVGHGVVVLHRHIPIDGREHTGHRALYRTESDN